MVKKVAVQDEVKQIAPVEIDELGEVRLKISTLKKREEELAKAIKERMVPGQIIMTENFRAEMIESNKRVLDFDAVRKAIGQKKFFEIATVAIGTLEKVLGKEEIDQVTKEYKPERILSIKPIA